MVNTLGSAPYYETDTARQRYKVQIKEEIKAPKIELSYEETANLSDTEFKTLVIRMLTEMVEYGHKIQEKVKAVKSDIKGTNSEGQETGLKSMVWTRRKK